MILLYLGLAAALAAWYNSQNRYLHPYFTKEGLFMPKKRILIQDIADALNLSRTTVSKVLNGNIGVSPKTRSRVLQKAAEMNYKQISTFTKTSALSDSQQMTISQHGNIALLYHKYPDKQHSGSSVLAATEKNISRYGYTLPHLPGSYPFHHRDMPVSGLISILLPQS